MIVIYDLPWENPGGDIAGEQARQLIRDIYALGVDEDALLMQPEEREFQFDFEIDHYIVLA